MTIETIIMTFMEYSQAKEEKKALPKYFYVNCLGDYVFIKTRSREVAQQYIDEENGKGKYRVRTYTTEKGSGTGCVAVETRKGQHVRNTSFGIFKGLK